MTIAELKQQVDSKQWRLTALAILLNELQTKDVEVRYVQNELQVFFEADEAEKYLNVADHFARCGWSKKKVNSSHWHVLVFTNDHNPITVKLNLRKS